MNTPALVRKLWNHCNVVRDGDELFDHYRHTLEAQGSEKGTRA